MNAHRNKTRRTANIFVLLAIILHLCGCAIGRSWDTPDTSDYVALPQTTERLIIYAPEYAALIESSLQSGAMPQAGSLVIKKISPDDSTRYPRLIITIEDSAYDNTFLYLDRLSFFTFSIIPGYFSESSRMTLKLQAKSNNGKLTTRAETYTAQRSFLMWLPLFPFANFAFTTMGEWGISNTDAFWDSAYKHYIRQFIKKHKDLIFRTYRPGLSISGMRGQNPLPPRYASAL